MSTERLENLELEAVKQRGHLHKSTDELRAKITATREDLNVSKQAREHLVAVSLFASIISLGLGYGLAGMFTRH